MSFSKLPNKEAAASAAPSSSSSSSSSSSKIKGKAVEASSPLSTIVNIEAEVSKLFAEKLFKENKIGSALSVIDRARLKNPNRMDLNSQFVCYVVHKFASEKRSWYAVLGIKDHGVAVDVIEKRYEGMYQLLQPSNCSSVAAESAIKLLNEAWGVLSDPKRREAYDMLMGYDNHNVNVQSENRNLENNNNNNVVVKLEEQNLENCNRPSIAERIRGNSRPASASASSSSSPSQSPSRLLHGIKKVLIVKRKNGQNTGNTDKVIIITRKPAIKK